MTSIQLEVHGFAAVPNAVSEAARERLLEVLRPERLAHSTRHPSGVVFASRHLLAHLPGLAEELRRSGVDALAAQFLGRTAFAVDAVYFDKQSAANWAVPVHQDRVLPVAADGGGKHKMVHGVAVAEPNAVTLSRLLALRIHFDPTDVEHGALFVHPGSHAAGVRSPEQVQAIPFSAFVPVPPTRGMSC